MIRAATQRKGRDGWVQIAQKGRQVVDVPGPHQPFSRTARAEPDEVGQTAFFLYAAPERRKSGCAIDHAGPPRFALIASARPAAHLVMSPAPRQMTTSPGSKIRLGVFAHPSPSP